VRSFVLMSRKVANDAVWSRETEIVGEEVAPGNGGVERVKNIVECILFGGIQRWLLLLLVGE